MPTSEGRVLVVDDASGLVQDALAERGCAVELWQRVQNSRCPGTAWPECEEVDAATIRLTKDKTAFVMALHAIASKLKTGGEIWVYGANDEGIKSSPKRLSIIFDDVVTVDSRRHCRILRATRPEAIEDLKATLGAWARETVLEFEDGPVEQVSFPGVFAKGRLDPGTKLLLDSIPAPEPGTQVLDYAAGSGVIALGLSRAQSGLDITVADADAVSIEAARQNLPHASAVVVSRLTDLPDTSAFDLIVANPPYHDGKARSEEVVRALIQDAPTRMAPGAELWVVLQRQVSVVKLLNTSLSDAKCVAENRRYRVWKATNPAV